MVASILGKDIDTDELVTLKQKQRQGGLYVIGKTRSGKTTLLVNLILQDIEQERGVCFLDPHGDAINDILARLPSHRERDIILFDPMDKDYAFGLNFFQCDPTDEAQVSYTRSYVLEVFAKLFTKSGTFTDEAPNMELTLRNATYTIIDNLAAYGAAMTEIPLLIDDDSARTKLMTNITSKHAPASRFW